MPARCIRLPGLLVGGADRSVAVDRANPTAAGAGVGASMTAGVAGPADGLPWKALVSTPMAMQASPASASPIQVRLESAAAPAGRDGNRGGTGCCVIPRAPVAPLDRVERALPVVSSGIGRALAPSDPASWWWGSRWSVEWLASRVGRPTSAARRAV